MSLTEPVREPDGDVLDLDRGIEALKASPEFDGPVDTLDPGGACNDHLALLYERREEQLAALVPFVRQGIERGERVIYVTGDLGRETLCSGLEDGGVDVDAALASGALAFFSPEETYLRNETFDPDEMISFYADAIAEATTEFSALRVAAETTWLDGADISMTEFLTYESKVNALFEDEACIALCQYDRTAFEPEVIHDIIQSHPHLIYDGTVCHNVYYTPPAEFFGPDRIEREIERMMATLVDRAEARVALQEREGVLHELARLTTDAGRSFEAKLADVLEVGREWFGLDIGFFARVDQCADRLEIVEAAGSHELIQPGTTADLSETYCRAVVDADGPVSVRDAVAEGWADEPAYDTYGLAAYVGTELVVDGDCYGTLCFGSQTPRTDPFDAATLSILELLGQWTSHELVQRRRENQLAALNDMGQELMCVETREEIPARTVDHAETALQLPVAAVLEYDGDRSTLRPVAQTPRAEDELPTAALCDRDGGPLWEAFVAGERRRLEDPPEVAGASTDLTEVLSVPIGRRGLFVVGTTAPNGLSVAGRDVVATTAATVEAASTRADREAELRRRETTLESQNETLERLNRVNDIIRSIDQALVGATSRSEIERVVCDQLAGVGPYELAWIGDAGGDGATLTPKEWAGVDHGYLEELREATHDSQRGGPAESALRTGRPQVVEDVLGDEAYALWCQAALDRGYHACVALPLDYGESFYGVLTVYAGKPGVFDDLEQSVLTELADTIAYAINAVESKKAIVSDEVTHLEFALDEVEIGVVDVARAFRCDVSLENLVPGTDGTFRAFVSTRGAPPDELREAADRLPLDGLTLVATHDDGDEPFGLFEAALPDRCLFTTVLEHGGRPCSFEITDGDPRITVELAANAAVREFVEMFRAAFPGAELVAQRTCERPQQTATEFFAGLTDALTDRQLETLQMAYYSGYLEEPRRQRATDVAETMEITQPTFNSHLRAAQRKLCEQLFEGRAPKA